MIKEKAVWVHEERLKAKQAKDWEREEKRIQKLEKLRKEQEIREKGTLEAYDKISEKKW